MRLTVTDIIMLLELMKRRSTDVAITATIAVNGAECRFTFGDVDNQIITVTLYDSDSNRMARITQTENLEVALRSLKK